jgi:hypothetical protein
MYVSTKLKLFGCLFLAATCYGDTINFVGTSAALGANDSILWGQLGSDGGSVSHNFSTLSAGGSTVTGSFAGTTGLVSVACPSAPQCSWGPATGIAGGDALIWAFDPNGNNGNGAGTGAVGLDLPNIFGAGGILAADVLNTSFTARLELFNGLISLGSVSVNSDANGDPIFIGALDATGPNVTKAVFSLTSISGGGDLGDFALGTVSLNQQLTPAPEPASLFLVAGSLLALGWKLKRRV